MKNGVPVRRYQVGMYLVLFDEVVSAFTDEVAIFYIKLFDELNVLGKRI